MKILIIGSGIIGTIYGWALSESGNDVTHLVRPGKKDLFDNGVTLDLLDERKNYPSKHTAKYNIVSTEEVTQENDYELIIVPVNIFQAEEVISVLAPLCDNSMFLIMSSNWEGTAYIDRYLPKNRYILGYPDAGGTIRNGIYWTNIGGEIHLGDSEDVNKANIEKISTLFLSAGIKPDIQKKMLHWLWLHNVSVSGFAAGFFKHLDFKSFLNDKNLLRQSILSTKELIELCKHRGVDIKEFPEYNYFNLSCLASGYINEVEL